MMNCLCTKKRALILVFGIISTFFECQFVTVAIFCHASKPYYVLVLLPAMIGFRHHRRKIGFSYISKACLRASAGNNENKCLNSCRNLCLVILNTHNYKSRAHQTIKTESVCCSYLRKYLMSLPRQIKEEVETGSCNNTHSRSRLSTLITVHGVDQTPDGGACSAVFLCQPRHDPHFTLSSNADSRLLCLRASTGGLHALKTHRYQTTWRRITQ